MQQQRPLKLIGIIFLITILFFMCTIFLRFFTRQVCIEMLHMDNAFTRLVFIGNSAAADTPDPENEEVFVDVDWASLYPFKNVGSSSSASATKLGKYENLVNTIETTIQTYTESLLIGQAEFVQVAKKYNSLIGSKAMNGRMGTQDDRIIFLNNGYLTYEEEAVSTPGIQEIASSIGRLSSYCKERDIDFLYANAGSKVCPYDKQLPAGSIENTNENADELIAQLLEHGVNVLDYRNEMKSAGLDWYGSYYVTDHHWKTTTGLWAAGVMANYLNKNLGFNFTLSNFDRANYDITVFDDYWIGGQGRKVTFSDVSLEPYERVLPNYETDLHIEVPTKDIDMAGSFDDVMFDEKKFEGIKHYNEKDHLTKPDPYGCSGIDNSALTHIENNMANGNEGKKILFIQDSFSWYSTAFLSCDIDEVFTLHPSAFTGSIETFIEKEKPDAVIVVYCERQMGEINWNTHQDMYDLR